MKKCLLCFLAIWGINTATYAQSLNFENLQVHFDKPFYLTGETMHFSVFFTMPEQTIFSEIVRVEIANPNGQIVEKLKLKRSGTQAEGSFSFPAEWQTGNYAFRFYTLWNLNYSGQNYSEYFIPVYSSITPPLVDSISMNLSQKVSDVKQIFPVRSIANSRNKKVEIDLNFPTEETYEYTINVLDTKWVDYNLVVDNERNKTNEKPNFPTQYPPEKELFFKTKLTNPEDGSLFDSDYILVHDVTTENYYRAPCKKGNFIFNLPEFTGERSFQIHNLNPYLPLLPEVQLENPTLPKVQIPALSLPDSTVLKYWELTNKIRKLQEIYPEPQLLSNLDSASLASNNVNGKPDRSYDIRSYEKLANLEEFVEDIIVTARLEGKAGAKSVRLLNRNKNKRYPNAPVYFVNGYLAGNEVEILQIPLSQIERVDVFNSRETIAGRFPDFMIGMGVLSIKTRTDRVPQSITTTFNNFEISGINPAKAFTKSKNKIDEKKPDFRPTIHWEAGSQSAANGQAKLVFYPSASYGEYLINVTAKSASGELITAQKRLQIIRD